MKMSWILAALLGSAIGTAACDRSETKTKEEPPPAAQQTADEGKQPAADKPDKAATKPAATQGAKTVDDAKKHLAKFLEKGVDQHKLLREMAPTDADLKAIFADDVFDKAKAHYEKMFAEPGSGSLTKEGQTELLVWAATSEELKEGTGDAGKFPGGYKKVADKLKPGLTFFRFKFVKPGETLGMAFDGLTYVNDRWVMVPKPWRAL